MTQTKKKKITFFKPSFLLQSFLLLALAVFSFRTPTDPDLGWHLRNGADILRFGPPKGDLYSWTMAGYPWISHEWGTEAVMSFLYQNFGLVALGILFILVAIAAFILAASVVSRLGWVERLIVALLGLLVSFNIVGIRPQMITLLGLALVLFILFRWREKPQSNLVYFLPLVFVVWVNLHSGFAAGFLAIAVFGAVELWRWVLARYYSRVRFANLVPLKRWWHLVWVSLLGLAATFINPYTWRVYGEIYNTLSNKYVMSTISEWLPVSLRYSSSYNFAILAVAILLLLFWTWRKVDVTKVVLALVFFLVGTVSWRNIPLFGIASLPLVAEMVQLLVGKGIKALASSYWAVAAVLIVTLFLGYHQFVKFAPSYASPACLAAQGRYPYGAVQFIKANPKLCEGRMFNEYNWGGYLIWQLPEKKVFIDGRMAIWRTPQKNAYEDSRIILDANMPHRALALLDERGVGLVFIYRKRALNKFLKDNKNWELIYGDPLSMLWRRTAKEKVKSRG